MPGIELRNVVKTFGKVTALKGVNLIVNEGEFFVLVGPTGAGKTTTLRVVSGLEKIDSGQILIGGEDARDLSPAERDVAFVYQSFSLYPQLTVRKNIEFPLQSPMHRESRDEIARRVAFAAELLHITPLLDRMPNALSGGEMQRVGIGRAIVRKPRVFLMDEPLSDLDAKLREELRVELRQIQQELKTMTLYVTHDQTEAMSMGDRIAVLNDGVVHQVGIPQDVYANPADLFVAGFIGNPKINLFDCSIASPGGAPMFSLQGGLIEARMGARCAKWSESFRNKDGLVVGVRPEAVKITREKSDTKFEAEVLFIEHFGSMNIVNLQKGKRIFKARTNPLEKVEQGSKVWVELDDSRVMFFDKATGKAMPAGGIAK
jgi:multiple sugar transport system ATP-binding protein